MDVDKPLITTEMWDISDIAAEIGDNKDEDDEGDTVKVLPIYTTAFDQTTQQIQNALETLRDFFSI